MFTFCSSERIFPLLGTILILVLSGCATQTTKPAPASDNTKLPWWVAAPSASQPSRRSPSERWLCHTTQRWSGAMASSRERMREAGLPLEKEA